MSVNALDFNLQFEMGLEVGCGFIVQPAFRFFRMFYHAAFLTIKETVTGTPALTLSSCEQPRLKDAVM